MNILIVEDNPAHLKITEYIIRKHNIDANLLIVHDGQEALDYLFRKSPTIDEQSYPFPDLILLDFNLPKRDGREVLKLIKDDERLQKIPVVVFSTSDREEDITYAQQLGVAAYISKSSGFDNFGSILGSITRYAGVK